MPAAAAVPMPDHEDVHWIDGDEFGAFIKVAVKAFGVLSAYDRDPVDIGSEIDELREAFDGARAAYQLANERRLAYRAAEVALLERRFGPELWG